MSDDELPDGARVRRDATDPESIRHEEALRALAVANLRAWTASRPGDEIDVMSFEIDNVVGQLVEHPDELAGFIEETATMLGSLWVQLAEAIGLTRSECRASRPQTTGHLNK